VLAAAPMAASAEDSPFCADMGFEAGYFSRTQSGRTTGIPKADLGVRMSSGMFLMNCIASVVYDGSTAFDFDFFAGLGLFLQPDFLPLDLSAYFGINFMHALDAYISNLLPPYAIGFSTTLYVTRSMGLRVRLEIPLFFSWNSSSSAASTTSGFSVMAGLIFL